MISVLVISAAVLFIKIKRMSGGGIHFSLPAWPSRGMCVCVCVCVCVFCVCVYVHIYVCFIIHIYILWQHCLPYKKRPSYV
jgi:hypothetical protein